MTREELIKKVALKMDEISSSGGVIVSVGIDDNNPLYTQINGLLNESINEVLTKAPVYRIENFVTSKQIGNKEYSQISIGDRYAYVFSVPNDFIRLVSIQDSTNFKRPIVDLSIEGDDISKRQRNNFLVAKSEKPVAVIGRHDGVRSITCYSYAKNAMPNIHFYYIARFDGDLTIENEIKIDEYLSDVATWVCAGKVFSAQGDVNRGKICDDTAISLMA